MDNAYCDFEFTGNTFNKKRVYECSYCHTKLALEDATTKVLCFKKMMDFTVSIKKIDNPQYEETKFLTNKDVMQDIVLQEVIKKYPPKTSSAANDNPENLCSEKQVQDRLAICKSCEHYQDDSCSLCGCVIVREINYMNKLAHKDQKCPIDKWGTILD
jgi:hypothetical protein